MSHVVVVGAGPAGACISYLLAKRGVEVTLLERRRDFAREFRGEVLMPSGIEALEQMGLDACLTEAPTYSQQSIAVYMNGRLILSEDLDADSFRGRPPLAVSQPALLEAVVDAASESQSFQFRRGVSVKELINENDRICGVRINTDDGELVLPADLVIGADGRNSVVRREVGLKATQMSPPMDIVWCKIPCPGGWNGLRAYLGRGHLLAAYHTWDDTLQLGWVILKGTFGDLKKRGIEEWIEEMANHVTPDLAAQLRAHRDAADRPFLLASESDCVDRWSAPGVMVIGDAAHTMSPVAGQGINIALRDAIVAANRLVPVLAKPAPDQEVLTKALHSIERERMPEIAHIQAMQAQPPKVLLNRDWWGEPVRRIAAAALRQKFIRQRAAERVAAFPYGVTKVELTV